jgi:hypothetical protein
MQYMHIPVSPGKLYQIEILVKKRTVNSLTKTKEFANALGSNIK